MRPNRGALGLALENSRNSLALSAEGHALAEAGLAEAGSRLDKRQLRLDKSKNES
jgi:hypothetical protein